MQLSKRLENARRPPVSFRASLQTPQDKSLHGIGYGNLPSRLCTVA